MPEPRRSIFSHFFHDRVLLEHLLGYYQSTHKPEYGLNPVPENQHPDIRSGRGYDIQELSVNLRNPFLVQHHPLGHCCANWVACPRGMQLHLMDVFATHLERLPWLLDEVSEQPKPLSLMDHLQSWCRSRIPLFKPTLQSNDAMDNEKVERANFLAMTIVDWALDELSPENFEASILPELLCVRVYPNVRPDTANDPYSLRHPDNSPDKLVDGEGRLAPVLSPLVTGNSVLIDKKAHPPGRPIAPKVLEEAAKAMLKESA